ncbi:hypothetical protein BJ508DRAFT_314544 [Ascobolus immersus RN42]|uniref:Uncharacterized protein n=1 Tax=Ascobolus immersus RN42 TaxID=1160509 RepID=A0A3N4HSM1_ASCIM|nr:hypothetical protein BJ508DRAFT_314544 [Ascobolus immersus RN42]
MPRSRARIIDASGHAYDTQSLHPATPRSVPNSSYNTITIPGEWDDSPPITIRHKSHSSQALPSLSIKGLSLHEVKDYESKRMGKDKVNDWLSQPPASGGGWEYPPKPEKRHRRSRSRVRFAGPEEERSSGGENYVYGELGSLRDGEGSSRRQSRGVYGDRLEVGDWMDHVPEEQKRSSRRGYRGRSVPPPSAEERARPVERIRVGVLEAWIRDLEHGPDIKENIRADFVDGAKCLYMVLGEADERKAGSSEESKRR